MRGVSNSYLLGAGHRTGIYWAINPYNGGIFWGNLVGQGAIKWGTAINTDYNSTALIAIDNGDNHINNTLAGSPTVAPFNWNAGSWGSINLRTGHMIWQLSRVRKRPGYPCFRQRRARRHIILKSRGFCIVLFGLYGRVQTPLLAISFGRTIPVGRY